MVIEVMGLVRLLGRESIGRGERFRNGYEEYKYLMEEGDFVKEIEKEIKELRDKLGDDDVKGVKEVSVLRIW